MKKMEIINTEKADIKNIEKHYIIREMIIKYKNYKKTKTIKIGYDEEVYKWFRKLRNEMVEKFITIYLNNSREIICFSVDFVGGMTSATVDVRIIIRNCCLVGATAIITIHNHPSGDITFSNDDKKIIQKITKACRIVDIQHLDSIVIGYHGFRSALKEKILDPET